MISDTSKSIGLGLDLIDLSMQVEMSLQWECMFSALAKYWAIKEEVLEPNASSNPLMAVISDNGTLERIRKKVVAQEAKVRT